MNVELRTARVIAAEAVPKSKKLIKLQVDLGTRAAHDSRRHRRGVPTRIAGRPDDRHRRQPEAGQADGHRVERHGARRQSGRRQARAADRRCRARLARAVNVEVAIDSFRSRQTNARRRCDEPNQSRSRRRRRAGRGTLIINISEFILNGLVLEEQHDCRLMARRSIARRSPQP